MGPSRKKKLVLIEKKGLVEKKGEEGGHPGLKKTPHWDELSFGGFRGWFRKSTRPKGRHPGICAEVKKVWK